MAPPDAVADYTLPPAPPSDARTFILPPLRIAQDRCRRAAGDEILVCGRRDQEDRYRLRMQGPHLGGPTESGDPLEFELGGVRMEPVSLNMSARTAMSTIAC